MRAKERHRIKELMAEWDVLRFGLSEHDAAEAWAESMAFHETQDQTVESEARAQVLDELKAAVEKLIEEAGGRCVRPADQKDCICETHSELLFDGGCEDQPHALLAVLRLIEEAR